MSLFFLEIKNRFALLITSLIFSIFVSYIYKNVLIYLLIKPITIIENQKYFYFVFTNLTELFTCYLKLAYFVGLNLTGYYGVYNIVTFLSPALYNTEKNSIQFLGILSFVFWLTSNSLIYYVVFPYSWDFFLSFQQNINTNNLNTFFEANISEFILFLVNISILNNFLCQIFILLYCFLKGKKNNIKFIKSLRKTKYVCFFIAATIISPPDIISQLLIGITLIFIYEILVYIIIIKKIFYGNQLKLIKIPDVNIK